MAADGNQSLIIDSITFLHENIIRKWNYNKYDVFNITRIYLPFGIFRTRCFDPKFQSLQNHLGQNPWLFCPKDFIQFEKKTVEKFRFDMTAL